MSIDLDDPVAVMLAAAGALERAGVECVAYGGLALGMYGEPRETRDADFAVEGVVTPRSRRLAESVLRRAVQGTLRGQEIRAISPEDFVILKVHVTRERDLEDARSVIETQRARLDEAVMGMEIEQLIIEIPDHDVAVRFARLFSA